MVHLTQPYEEPIRTDLGLKLNLNHRATELDQKKTRAKKRMSHSLLKAVEGGGGASTTHQSRKRVMSAAVAQQYGRIARNFKEMSISELR